jgi:hypothetical protein
LEFVILHTVSISLIYIQVNLVAKNPLQKRNLGAKKVEKGKHVNKMNTHSEEQATLVLKNLL